MTTSNKTAVRFDIGTTLHIEKCHERLRIRGSSRVIGGRPPRYMIAEIPIAQGKPMFSAAGEKCIVRYLHNGNMYGFWADIVQIFAAPFPMMILEYPQSIKDISLREHERLACNFSAMATFTMLDSKEKTAEDAEAQDAEAEAEQSAEQENPLPSGPVVTLRSKIIDLAEGGCQIAIRMESAEDAHAQSGGNADEAFVPYSLESLKAICSKNRRGSLTFDLPAPGEGKFPDVACEVRWAGHRQSHFFVGLRFLRAKTAMVEKIRAITAHQNRYFSKQIQPL